MKNDSWEAVHSIFRKLDELFGRERVPSVSEAPPSSQDEAEFVESGQPSAERTFQLDDLLHARSELRKELDVLRARLAERLSERDAYLVLFALVAHFDELVQTRFLKGDSLNWPTLQRELFQVDDAGELFYETLDDVLMKPQSLPFVLEVFYLCLSDGFKGRYAANPAKIREYMDRVRQKIPMEAFAPVRREDADSVLIETRRSPISYYVSALVVLLAFYGMLMTAAWIWNPLKD
ncbi:MAG: DotU family type IV/VI secretion system protein [Syntrophobacteraceae bacterium]